MKKLTIGLVAAFLSLASQPLLAQEGPMSKIADGVYNFWQGGYASMVVIGEKGVLLIDPANPTRAKSLKAEIAKLTDKPVTHVALSHEHFDHVGGTELFKDAKVVCHASCEDTFALSPLLPAPKVDVSFEKSLEVDLGGKVVEFLHPAIGDGNGATIARVKGEGIAFNTDMYRSKGFAPGLFIEHSNFVGVRQIMHQLQDWKPNYVINGHGAGNSLADLNESTEMYDKLYDAVNAEISKAQKEGGMAAVGQLLFTISGKVRLDEYKDWDGYEQNFPAYVKRMMLSIVHGG